MPTINSSAKGYSGLVTEATPGLQQLLTPTLISALPVSLTSSTALTAATTGMHLLIRVYNHTATGTITVTGTAPGSLAVVSETTRTMELVKTTGMYADYVTSAVFGAVNSSGVTLGGGLTNGSVTIYGIQATQKMVVGEWKLTDKRTEHTPVWQRGDFAESHTGPLPMSEDPEWEYQSDFWPDECLWVLYGGVNSAQTVVSKPASPVAVLASTSVVTAGTVSASIQPTAPGMILQCVIGGAPATAATVAISGTNIYGEAITETIVASTKTAGTYTSLNSFATITASGIAYGNFGGSATLTVNAVFGWTSTANTGDTFSTFAAAQYDGIGSYVAPFCMVGEWSIEGGPDKETKVMAKGPTQAVLPVGVNSTFTSQIPALAQPLDEAVMGWRALVYIDPITNTPGTTLNPDVTNYKVTVNNKLKPIHTQAWNPVARWFSRIKRNRREIMVEVKVDIDSQATLQEYLQWFKQSRKRLIQIQIIGLNQLGTTGGTTYYPGWTITVPVRWEGDPGRVFTVSQESIELTLKGRAYLDPALNYDLQVLAVTRYPSW